MATKKKEALIDEVQVEVPEILSELGGALKQAREAQKLSIEDVRNRLHVNESQIIALEQDDFGAFGDSTRARGFIRSYARFLGLNEEALLEKHRQLYPSDTLNALGVKTETLAMGAQRNGMPRYVFVAAGFALLALLVWFLSTLHSSGFSQKAEIDLATSSESLSEPLLPSPELSQEAAEQSEKEIQLPPPPEKLQAADAGVTAAPNKAEPAKAPEVKLEATPKTNAATGSLKLVVTESAWVDVKDSTGKSVLTKVVKPGADEVVQGLPPFKVHVGNAKATQLIYNGQPFDYSASTYNNSARVTLGAP